VAAAIRFTSAMARNQKFTTKQVNERAWEDALLTLKLQILLQQKQSIEGSAGIVIND